ncbi:hypothetical protein [Mycolicibacterium conceptionense]|uniref:hypothetical protein n=1 Tax=Mycolicibacterium conceptionense TaxID=451644 RepID=UPI0020C2ECBE|nr:hypothetical protein [Mycolicibacterium conceptionense]
MIAWAVCDVDDGILRVEPTRRAAVRWLTFHCGGEVLMRYAYGPGKFEYTVGLRGEDDPGGGFVVRTDRLAASGWDSSQPPLYPFADDPHERVERVQNSLEESDSPEAATVVVQLPQREVVSVDESRVLDDLIAAHADLERLTAEIGEVRERRRKAARELIELGRGPSWIARQLGVTPQAVDGFLKYKERKQQAG